MGGVSTGFAGDDSAPLIDPTRPVVDTGSLTSLRYLLRVFREPLRHVLPCETAQILRQEG